jgi:hypothetical protein
MIMLFKINKFFKNVVLLLLKFNETLSYAENESDRLKILSNTF